MLAFTAVALAAALATQAPPDASAPVDSAPAESADAPVEPPPADAAPPPAEPPPAASPNVTIGLAIQPPLGLDEAEAKAIQQKIIDELRANGVGVESADAVDAACVPDPACVEGARGARAGLLVVEMVRVGPVLQLTATGAAEGAQVTGSQGLDSAQIAKGPILPDNVAGWAKSLAPAEAPPPPPPPAKPALKLTPMQMGAIGAAGAGAVALVVGAILVGTSEGTLNDAKTTGDQKSGAVTTGWVGVAGVALGVVGLGVGGALFFLE